MGLFKDEPNEKLIYAAGFFLIAFVVFIVLWKMEKNDLDDMYNDDPERPKKRKNIKIYLGCWITSLLLMFVSFFLSAIVGKKEHSHHN